MRSASAIFMSPTEAHYASDTNCYLYAVVKKEGHKGSTMMQAL